MSLLKSTLCINMVFIWNLCTYYGKHGDLTAQCTENVANYILN